MYWNTAAPAAYKPPAAAGRTLPKAPRGRALERVIFAATAEAATPANLLGYQTLACSVPQVARQFAMGHLIECAERIVKDDRPWFSVRRGELWMSKDGQRLLESMAHALPSPAAVAAKRRRDPHVSVILNEAAMCLPLHLGSHALSTCLRADPARSAIVLCGLVSRLREELRAKEALTRSKRYRARDMTWFREISDYFAGLARDRPLLLRVELRGGYRPMAALDPGGAARDAHNLTAAWFDLIHGLLGDHLGGSAWRLQHDEDDGFHHHVLFALHGIDPHEIASLLASCGDTWRATAGANAWVMDCNAEGIDVEFRGRARSRVDGLHIGGELANAAAYFAWAGAFDDFDFADDPPQRGYRVRPKVLRLKAPAIRI